MTAGCFNLRARERSFGSEELSVDLSSGRLRLEAVTTVDAPRLRLRQTTIAEYDAHLRPLWCTVRATIDTRSLACDVSFEDGRVVVCGSGAGGPVLREFPPVRPPLLLVDNCFATHALAALSAAAALEDRGPADRVDPGPADVVVPGSGPAGSRSLYMAVPSGEFLTVVPGRRPVQVGGESWPPPTVTFELLPELQEHVWIEGSWAERLAIPQAHLRADWTPGVPERREAMHA